MGLGIVADLLNIVIFFLSLFLMGLVHDPCSGKWRRTHRRPRRLGRIEPLREAGPAISSRRVTIYVALIWLLLIMIQVRVIQGIGYQAPTGL